jgi:endo-1,4-beta-xylanase
MKKYQVLIIGITLLTFSGCLKGQVDPILPSPDLNIVIDNSITLKNAMPFPMGAAINNGLIKNRAVYRELLVKEYNSLTSENEMKFAQLHPAENTYTFTEADFIVDFAKQNNMRVHGHTLIWYKNVPNWVLNYQGDKTAWENLLRNHVRTVVLRYKGKVKSWDVVNEAISDQNGALRDCIWLQKLGEDYIAKSFIYAREADPDALLFYNDYGNEFGPTKRTAINNLVLKLKNAGVPIDGIGLQMHTRYTQSDDNLANAINTAAATGLKVHIAELDIAVNPDNIVGLTFSAGLAAQQKAKYQFIVKTYHAIPKNQQFGITTWNLADADTWIRGEFNRPDWPLPFDDQYQKKPAYQGILDGIK